MAVIEAIASVHDVSQFDCGEPSETRYLTHFALANDRRGLGRTYVAVEPGSARVLGYFTLCSASIDFSHVPENLPHYPIPASLLARLAVDRACQGMGLGGTLIIEAMRGSLCSARVVGSYAMVLDARNDGVAAMYSRYGFQPLLDHPHHMYLPMKRVEKLLVGRGIVVPGAGPIAFP